MKKKEIEKITKMVTKTKEIICDRCNRTICDVITPKSEKIIFYEVHTYHEDWGGDSGDSSKYLDVCSLDCLLEDASYYFSRANGTEHYDIERVEEYPNHLVHKK